MANQNKRVTVGCTGDGDVVQKISLPRILKFTVHFRRLLGSGYDGSFGFDWLRDEYIYDIEKVYELGLDPITNDARPARLCQGDVTALLAEYTRLQPNGSDLPALNEIYKVLCETYIPAWLAVFPDTHPSGQNSQGVDLYLQVEQARMLNVPISTQAPLAPTTPTVTIDSIIDPASISIAFVADSGIEVTTSIKTLADLINVAKTDLKLPFNGSELKGRVVKRYQDVTKPINIKATSGSSEVRLVRIKATDTLTNETKTVGLLCVYPNAVIKKAHIKVVHCLTHRLPANDGQQNQLKVEKIKQTIMVNPATGQTGTVDKVIETRPSTWASSAPKAQDILLKLEEKSFNQALIDTTISTDYFSFQNEASHSLRIREFLANAVYQATVSKNDLLAFSKELADIYYYEKVSKHTDIEADTNKTTYLLLTEHKMQDTLSPGLVGGMGWPTEAVCDAGNHKCSVTFGDTFKGGNFTIIFKTKYSNIHHLVHELGHSLSLPHTFPDVGGSTFKGVHYFYKGYTDNIMDYRGRLPPPATVPGLAPLTSAELLNPNTMNATYKWQWDILRKDNTLR